MNIHPIFVHFPIAFLTVYAIFECVTVKSPRRTQTLLYIKAVMLWVGTIGAFFALQTGEMAEELVGRSQLLQAHSLWANGTTYIFSALSLLYIVLCGQDALPYVRQRAPRLNPFFVYWEKLIPLAVRLHQSALLVVIALLGFVAITVTGALGGALVYGVDADPFVRFIYQLLFPQ